jgi:hypothetical protein
MARTAPVAKLKNLKIPMLVMSGEDIVFSHHRLRQRSRR